VKRFLRILLNAATAVSLLLCVATVVLWVRSYVAFDLITLQIGGRSAQVWTPRGRLNVEWASRPYFRPRWMTQAPVGAVSVWEFLRPEHSVQTDVSGKPHRYAWLGFIFSPTYEQPASRDQPACWFTTLGVPCYALLAITAVLPARRGWHALRQRSRLPGLCPACGYDLRATPERCPECGAIPAG
jgi:hypothetical protein